MLPLGLLRRGENAEICQVLGNDRNVRRLHEMGICSGNRLQVVQSGCPCIVRLRGAKYCLRDVDCQHILVSLVDEIAN